MDDKLAILAIICCVISASFTAYSTGRAHGVNTCTELVDEQSQFIDYILNGEEQ